MANNDSDPLNETKSEVLDANEAKPPAIIEPDALATSGPQDDYTYFLTPYCCDGHNDEWLVPGMHSPGMVPDAEPPIYRLGPVELMTPNADQPQTVWRTSMWGDGTFSLYNTAFLGGGVGILTAPYDDSPVEVIAEGDLDKHKDRYRFTALPVLDGTWYMLQLVENPGVYLNVSGDGPYPAGTQILVYSSPGAEANQVWRFHVVSAA